MRRSALELAGPLSEYFFMYAEDLAYSIELKKAGKLIYFPQARVYHLQEERQRGKYQVKWLDSLFTWYLLHRAKPGELIGQEAPRAISLWLKLGVVKLIFMAGFMLRLMGYSLWAGLSQKKTTFLKTREMAVYLRHMFRVLFNQEISFGDISR